MKSQNNPKENNYETPQIWHHGLVAQYWAEHETDGNVEAGYYQNLIETSGQPALDLGCGSGRLLIPYLQAGLDVDGCDFSADMISVCRERAQSVGLSPKLFIQGMHELNLTRRYKTIFARGVIGLGGSHQLTREAMKRCYDHLQYGGTFAFDYMVRWNDPPAWLARLPKHRQGPTEEWPESSEREGMSDGSEIELATRTLSTDPLENIVTRQIRARLWRDGKMVQEEIHTQKLDDYSKNELLLMLELAGFKDVKIHGDFSEEPANMDHSDLIFLAAK